MLPLFTYYFINAEGIKLILGVFGWFEFASRYFLSVQVTHVLGLSV